MADVFVLPSLNETWGLSVNEAMVCGCAVLLSSTIGSAPDLVTDGFNGYVFQLNNQNEMIEIASIPPLQVLRGMFVNVINSPIQGFVIALDAIASKKS